MSPVMCWPLLPVIKDLNQYLLPGVSPLMVQRLVVQMVFTHTLSSVGGSTVYSKPKVLTPLWPSTFRSSSPELTPFTILKLEGGASTTLCRFFLKGMAVLTSASTLPSAVLATELPSCTHKAISSARRLFLAAIAFASRLPALASCVT